MRPHSNDTLVLPFSPFPHPRFTGLQEISLHFGPHDTQERRIVSYRFSYRCLELCLFEALYPAPLARSFYILMHRHRPTRCPHKTHRMRNLCHSRSEAHAFHTCAAHFSVFLICLSYRQCPIRPFGAPSPRGEGFAGGIVFPHMHVFALTIWG